ncbi:MAG: hypothetical protein ABI402_21175 [Ferruginibacter sp.]
MTYSFTLLSSKEDCDAMISIANKNKAALAYKKITLLHKKEISTGNAVEIETELQAVNAELASLETVIASLPEGDIKKDYLSRKTKLEFKKFTLNENKESYGVLSLLDTEIDIGCIDKDVEETDAFIAGINDRKAAL